MFNNLGTLIFFTSNTQNNNKYLKKHEKLTEWTLSDLDNPVLLPKTDSLRPKPRI